MRTSKGPWAAMAKFRLKINTTSTSPARPSTRCERGVSRGADQRWRIIHEHFLFRHRDSTMSGCADQCQGQGHTSHMQISRWKFIDSTGLYFGGKYSSTTTPILQYKFRWDLKKRDKGYIPECWRIYQVGASCFFFSPKARRMGRLIFLMMLRLKIKKTRRKE